MIMGLYLYISQAVFRRHSQEAFSSLRIADYKNFVRFHVDASGTLSIYAIGVQHVPRHWKQASSSGPVYEPAGRDRLNPRLIERVVDVR
jgi:hypothetical protein